MKRNTRIQAVLIAFAVLFIMLSSALYIAVEADHDCTGQDCPICEQIHVCENNLKNVSLAVCTVAFAAELQYILCRKISDCTDFVQSHTLVTFKVKLSN